jgi:hypothetical protein
MAQLLVGEEQEELLLGGQSGKVRPLIGLSDVGHGLECDGALMSPGARPVGTLAVSASDQMNMVD